MFEKIKEGIQMMSDPTSSVAGIFALKAYGFKALLGVIGAALLYMAMPPVSKDGTFNEKEFVFRIATAGFASMIFGDWAVQMVNDFAPMMRASEFPATIYLIVGAPAWWVSRAAALWLRKRENKDIQEVIKDLKK